jgi:hypothetical protein
MKWVTRKNCHVDRTACAWLIRRFIDPDAEFVFVDDVDEIPDGAIGFDMRGVALTHINGYCSFETFLRVYGLDDDALWAIARIIHEADLDDERYDAPEAPGLDVLTRGLSLVNEDPRLLEITAPLYDGLYAHYQRALTFERQL